MIPRGAVGIANDNASQLRPGMLAIRIGGGGNAG